MLRERFGELFKCIYVTMVEGINPRGVTGKHSMELSVRSE
jgi:hypothetical protein